MLKTFIRTTACLVVSAAAFIVIAKMDATAAAPRKTTPDEEPAAPPATKSAPAPKTSKEPKDPPPKLTMASLAVPAATAPAATRTGLDSALTVPDWKGKRLSAVRREARKLGFNVTAVNENGVEVPAEEASGYRVRRQLTKAGTPIEPGADVELRVREIVDTPSGY